MTGWQVAVAALVGMPGIVLGLLVLVRGPRIVGGLLITLGVLPVAVLTPDTVVPGTPPQGLGLVLAVMSAAGWVWLYVPPALLAAYVPDGRLGRRWWALPVGWGVFIVAFHTAVALDPETYGSGPGQITGSPPVDAPRWVGALLGVGSLALLLALLIGSAARVVVRFRRGDEVVRRQLKWFSLSILLLPIVLLVTWAAYLLTDWAEVVVVVGLLLVYASLPVSVAIAVLRHDLYDIDTLVSRTVAYTTLSTGVLALFAGITVGAGLVLGHGSGVAIAVATLLSAVAFELLRRRVQAAVDARFDRGRQHALAVLDQFLDDVRDGRAEPEDVEQALGVALRDPGLTVVYRPSSEGDTEWRTRDGEAAGRPGGRTLDVAVAGRPIACIGYEAAARRPRLLREALRRAHLPLELAHSRIALRHALAETRASRARLVEVTESERRRLERDLHDGAQQRLVAIGMALQLARQRADPHDPMRQVLGAAVQDLQGAVAELRHIAAGIRPRGLDEGLPTAIRELVRSSPVPVKARVSADAVPDAIATTAYYVAAESLANSLKHSEARGVAIDISRQDGNLVVLVSDDGHGGATERHGSGLAGLRDRVAATGGCLIVDSLPGTGTRVEARLPCES